MEFQRPPFNPDRLIHRRAIESNRVEFKATWDERTRPAVVRTVCAFANDLLNLNGGYLIIGVEEEGGRPRLPPRGLDALDLERVQKEIYGACARIVPDYQPEVYPVDYQGRAIVIVWAPGGPTRPYKAPGNVNEKGSPWSRWVRMGPQTVKARGELERQLFELTARVPFDDQPNRHARIEDLRPMEVRGFLRQVGSALVDSEQEPVDDRELYRRLRLVARENEHEVPRNVALLFFNGYPDEIFPGACIEVVRFPEGAGGDFLDERTFRGPLPDQIRSAMTYVEGLGSTFVRKVRDRIRSQRTVAYPLEAVKEAIVNGVYHRAYDGPPEPVKVYFYPDGVELTSYPGPLPGIEPEHFASAARVPGIPARNRRIGEFFKELELAEARGTGIPKIRHAMRVNGSPPPRFEFDRERTYFRVILPIHPQHRPAEEDADRPERPSRQTVLRTIAVTEVVDATALLSLLGDERFIELMDRHDRRTRELIVRCEGQEINRADGFLLLFDRPILAVRFALEFHREVAAIAEETGVALSCRVGIHLGELLLDENPPEAVARGARRFEIEGMARVVAARVASLAVGDQTLVTRSVVEVARPSAGAESELRWVGYGSYRLRGIPEPIEVFEVGEEGLAPFTAPEGEREEAG